MHPFLNDDFVDEGVQCESFEMKDDGHMKMTKSQSDEILSYLKEAEDLKDEAVKSLFSVAKQAKSSVEISTKKNDKDM